MPQIPELLRVPLRAKLGTTELGYLLRKYQEEHAKGSNLDATLTEETIEIGPHRRRIDRAIWSGLGRLPSKQEAPTIAVEFVSGTRRDRQRDYKTKRDEYRSVGVREYWIIDQFERQMTVYLFVKDKVTKRLIRHRQVYTTPCLPGFRLPVAKLFALADRWN